MLTIVGGLFALSAQAAVLISALALFIAPSEALFFGIVLAGVAGVVTVAYARGKGRFLTLLDWVLHTCIAVLLLSGLLLYDCWGVSPSMFAENCKFYDITILVELALASYAVVHLGGAVAGAVKWVGSRTQAPIH